MALVPAKLKSRGLGVGLFSFKAAPGQKCGFHSKDHIFNHFLSVFLSDAVINIFLQNLLFSSYY